MRFGLLGVLLFLALPAPARASAPLEFADPYVTVTGDSVIVSGTSEVFLRFPKLEDFLRAAPPEVVPHAFMYPDGTPMEEGANSWDLKPYRWPSGRVWYGGHMRPRPPRKVSRWPQDNYSRDVFAFIQAPDGRWRSQGESVFRRRSDWPRPVGSFLGHRYGHQIVAVPGHESPVIFYEEVTQVRQDGSPLVTQIFMDEMATPFEAEGRPTELLSPVDPMTLKPYPSALREDGAMLIEGPIYFRFRFGGEEREAIGFSAGSYYGKYPSCFASRTVSEGRQGKPYRLDLNDAGTDLNDAASELGKKWGLSGGPGRPAVIADPTGAALLDSEGRMQVLVHGYRPGESYRVSFRAALKAERRPGAAALRFTVMDLALPGGYALSPKVSRSLAGR